MDLELTCNSWSVGEATHVVWTAPAVTTYKETNQLHCRATRQNSDLTTTPSHVDELRKSGEHLHTTTAWPRETKPEIVGRLYTAALTLNRKQMSGFAQLSLSRSSRSRGISRNY
jgi:hypothetical protein